MTRHRLATACLAVALCATGAGCGGSDSTRSEASSPVTEPTTVSTTAPAAADDPCAVAEFDNEQFAGDWTDEGGDIVTTLADDGTLTARDGAETGTWSYTPWMSTPASDQMPDGAADQCVLWLRWSDGPDSDMIYVPLEVSETTLTLSYVGRGNTITWVRAR